MMYPEHTQYNVSLRREFGEPLLHFGLNYEIHDPFGMKAHAIEVSRDGLGVIVGLTHFSRREGIMYGDYALQIAQNRDVPVVFPVAHHIYEQFKPVLNGLARFFKGTLCPIVIDDTLTYEQYKDLPLGQGMAEYKEAAIEAISQGGVVAVSLQGGRKPSLSEPPRVLSTLLYELQDRGVTNFAVHFAGVNPKKPVMPSEFVTHDGWNPLWRYVLRPGRTFTFEQIKALYQLDRPRDYKQLDAWGFSNVAGLVQGSYLEAQWLEFLQRQQSVVGQEIRVVE